jgi:putative hydrolase of HD superfamily
MKRKSESTQAARAELLRRFGDEVPEAAAPLSAYYQAAELKRLYRQGWLKRGVPEAACESVADHSFGTALLALFLAGRPPYEGIDRDKALRIALVHELGEVYAGDITPVDGVSAEEKASLERDSIRRVLAGLWGGKEYLVLWEEFEAGLSPEACFVRELDRLEMGLQAAAYRVEGNERMGEFFESARRSVSAPGLRALLEAAIGAAEPSDHGEGAAAENSEPAASSASATPRA